MTLCVRHELGPDEGIELTLAAGGELTVMARVRDAGDTVKRLATCASRAAGRSRSVDRARRRAAPAEDEAEVEVRLHPPRSPEAEARRWPFWIEVAGAEGGGRGNRRLDRRSVSRVHGGVSPRRCAGRRAGRFIVRVHNRANARATVRLETAHATAPGHCRCEPARCRLALGRERPTCA